MRSIIKTFLLISIIILGYEPLSFAEKKLPDDAKKIMSLMTTSLNAAKNSVDFFTAGQACHRGILKKPVYFLRQSSVFFFFNDSLKNCNFALLMLPHNQRDTYYGSCIISDTTYAMLFTPWFLDALKNFDETQRLNANAQKFILLIGQCLEPVSGEALLSNLTEATKLK